MKLAHAVEHLGTDNVAATGGVQLFLSVCEVAVHGLDRGQISRLGRCENLTTVAFDNRSNVHMDLLFRVGHGKVFRFPHRQHRHL